MPQPKSTLALADALELWHEALAKQGLKITVSDPSKAVALRFRLYAARRHDQDHNRRIRSPDDPGYGRSIFDPFRIDLEGPVVKIIPSDLIQYKTEPL
jgi:hypothetical protein